jgi:hypothetical protein
VQNDTNNNQGGEAGYKILSSIGTQTALWTWANGADYSAMIATFEGSSLAPNTPANLTVTSVSGATVALSWTAPSSDPGITSYKIYRGTSPSPTTLYDTQNSTTTATYSRSYRNSLCFETANASIRRFDRSCVDIVVVRGMHFPQNAPNVLSGLTISRSANNCNQAPSQPQSCHCCMLDPPRLHLSVSRNPRTMAVVALGFSSMIQ